MTRTTFRNPYPARPDLPAPMSAALAVHPFLNEAGLFPELNREMTRI